MYKVTHFPSKMDLGAALLKAILPFTSKDETRAVLKNINVKEGFIYATDGHKAVKVSRDGVLPPEVTDGLYTVTKAGKDYILEPGEDFGRPFPDLSPVLKLAGDKEFSFEVTASKDALSTLAHSVSKNGPCILLSILEAVPTDEYKVRLGGEFKPIFFTGKRWTVVLMPYRFTAPEVKDLTPKDAVNA